MNIRELQQQLQSLLDGGVADTTPVTIITVASHYGTPTVRLTTINAVSLHEDIEYCDPSSDNYVPTDKGDVLLLSSLHLD